MATHACDTIIVDYSLQNEDEIPTEFCLQDEYPSLQGLKSTAERGCSFCMLLIASIDNVFIDQTHLLPVNFEISGKLLTESTLQSELEEDDNGVYLLLLDLTYGEEKVRLHFSIHAAEDTVPAIAGRIKRRLLHEDVAGDAAIELMKRWISECRDSHDGCQIRETSGLPTRVLDLGRDDLNADCKLVQSASIPYNHAPYIALSHCWGNPELNALPTTTSNTMCQRMSKISLESLPQNFRDAIAITRLLGVQYLWIDSLCIIQDSREDSEKEGGRMSQIYKEAYLTVAATAASSANDGFLARAPLKCARLPFRSPYSTSQTEYLFLRSAEGVTTSFERDVDLSTWNGRAWTLQERYLTRRIIHFCKNKFYFECRSGFQSEDNEPIFFTKLPAILEETTSENCSSSTTSKGTSPDTMAFEISEGETSIPEDNSILEVDNSFELYYRLIGQYSPRNLTFAVDKLPALAGIANEVHLQSGSRYLAGLWEDDLAYGLLWMAPDPEATSTTTIYRGPSWSWVHLEGQITWQIYWNIPDCPHVGRPAKSAIWIVDAHVHVPGLNPFGQVVSAFLILRAKYIPVRVFNATSRKNKRKVESSFQHDIITRGTTGRSIGFGQLDLRNSTVSSKETFCLQIHEQLPGIAEDENSWSGLILELGRDTDGMSPIYKRLGIYLLTEENLKVFKDVEECELKLI